MGQTHSYKDILQRGAFLGLLLLGLSSGVPGKLGRVGDSQHGFMTHILFCSAALDLNMAIRTRELSDKMDETLFFCLKRPIIKRAIILQYPNTFYIISPSTLSISIIDVHL
ncbi:hypothetical protein CHARACLAT_011736 [Characodon lateralis]|uniref:Uncharacterized protein n=1 Tax=Characodon lateralis TaxID=208331 RepID=A0ABU7DFR2_9TELE|nr:hypothetical protein [Characodon lateralis]